MRATVRKWARLDAPQNGVSRPLSSDGDPAVGAGRRGGERRGPGLVGLDGLAFARQGGTAPSEPADETVEAFALDELHGVIEQAAVLADAEDRHDIGVVQPAGGADLAVEPRDGCRSGGQRRQHLESDAAAQGQLDRLVDDPHPAAAHLADDLEARDGRQGGRAESVAASRPVARVSPSSSLLGQSGGPKAGPSGARWTTTGRRSISRSRADCSRAAAPSVSAIGRKGMSAGVSSSKVRWQARQRLDVDLDGVRLRSLETTVDELFQYIDGWARAHHG